MIEAVVEKLEMMLVEKIRKERKKDEEVTKVVEEMKKARVRMLRGDEQEIKEELILKEEKIYILKDKKLRLEVIQLHHDVLVVRYRGKWKIMKLVIRNYWQLEVTKDIGKYIEKYDLYQRIKNRMKVPAGKLMINKILKKLWIYLIVDLIAKLLLVVEKNAILVIYDRLSKIVYSVVTMEETSVKGLARLFRDIQKLYKLLESVILDKELQFATKLIKELNSILGIEIRLLIILHPQIDEQTE